MDKLVSIVIPVYNSESTLSRCIDSVLLQTYKSLEIILVDDASIDTSSKLCDDYAFKYDRISVIHKEKNEGLLLARKTGVMSSKGYYILNVDSDDYIEPCAVW